MSRAAEEPLAPRPGRGAPGLAAPLDALRRLLARPPPGELVLATVPGPSQAPGGAARARWLAPGGESLAAFGVCRALQARGAARFQEIEAGARTLLAAPWVVAPEVEGVPAAPRLLGGFAFEDQPPAGPWAAFGAASFELPRLCWVAEPGRAPILQVALQAADFARPGQCLGELEALLAAPAEERPPGVAQVVADDSGARYEANVARALQQIGLGALEKVVLARRRRYGLAGPVAPEDLLPRFPPEAAVTRFAFCRGEACFAGATPELLLAVRGDRFTSMALAGTSGQGEEASLAADKIQREHQVVVAEMVERLSPFARELALTSAPALALAHVSHALTRIGGLLRPGVGALQVARALHPTPAVAGRPRAPALALIAELEPPRGWYAGALGWIARGGDLTLVVGLRSALLTGGEALGFAGAGLVRGSDPASERAETELKLRTVEAALGVPP